MQPRKLKAWQKDRQRIILHVWMINSQPPSKAKKIKGKPMMNIKVLNKEIPGKSQVLSLLAILSYLSSPLAIAASAGTGGVGTAFSSGTTSLGIIVGSGSFNNDNYLILGGSVGYYVIKGLEVGVNLERWFSGDPAITKVSPQIQYVFTQPEVIKPYVGVFYRRTFIDGKGYEDQNSYGSRAGAYFSTKNGVYIGGGIVYEKYDNCSKFVDCSSTYPEIIVSINF
jgi:hypothetical protein